MQIQARVKDQSLISEKRRQILEGAIQVFKRKGYHKATVREIAEEAGISLGSIYDYVNSKDDILYLFFDGYATTFFEKVRSRASKIADPLRRLEIAYRAFLEVAMELEDQVMLSYTQARYVQKDYLKVILRKESEIVEHFKRIIDELGKGPFDPFLEANFLVYSGVFGVLRRWILRPRYGREEIIDYLVQTQVQEMIRRIQGKTIRNSEFGMRSNQ
ncbi:MAG: TetR/AcrR family transcriptional regulator [Syntrophaceae bacterium]|nr:TetR/AcrR family transcriptional regulator [Syntrophaceae bacterium]